MKILKPITVPDDAYNASSWDANVEVPTKNAIRDKIEGLTLDTSQITSGTIGTARLGSGTANSSSWLRGDSTWGNPLTIGNAITSGSNSRIFYQASGNLAQSANFTFDGTDLTLGGAGFAYFNNPYTMMLGSGLYIGSNGVNTGMYFRGGSTGSNTYGDFKYQVGGGSREMVLTNQLSSRYVLFVTGGSDADNVANSFVGFGSTSPVGKVHVQQSAAAYNVIVAEGASGQSGRLLAFMPFGAGSYLSAFDYAGNLAIGHGSPSAALDIIKTTEQIRSGYDSANYFKSTTASNADTTFDLVAGSGTPKFIFNKNIEASNLTSGTYTPTLSNTTNISASTARLCTYMRVGNTVTVSGQFDIDPISPAIATLLGMSLPIASAFTTVYQAGGTANAMNIAGMSAGIEADATNDRASIKFISSDVTNQTMTFTFTYQII